MTEAAQDIRFGVQLPTDTPAGPAGIGERLRAARRARGLSQRRLSAAGVTYAYICRIERGTRIPSLEVIRCLATALDVSPRWIETGEDDRWNGFSQAELTTLRAALIKSGGPVSLRLVAELTAALELGEMRKSAGD